MFQPWTSDLQLAQYLTLHGMTCLNRTKNPWTVAMGGLWSDWGAFSASGCHELHVDFGLSRGATAVYWRIFEEVHVFSCVPLSDEGIEEKNTLGFVLKCTER